MKRFGKLRKYIARLLGGAGTVMAVMTIGELLDYHEASERYWQQAEPIMDRLTEIDGSPEQAADRDSLIKLFQTKLTPEEFEQHVALIALGAFLERKKEPKPEAPPPPRPPWESVPPPTLVKSDSPVPQP